MIFFPRDESPEAFRWIYGLPGNCSSYLLLPCRLSKKNSETALTIFLRMRESKETDHPVTCLYYSLCSHIQILARLPFLFTPIVRYQSESARGKTVCLGEISVLMSVCRLSVPTSLFTTKKSQNQEIGQFYVF